MFENDLVTAQISIIKFKPEVKTGWQKTMEAWQCTLGPVAYAYSNVSVQSGKLLMPEIRTSRLNQTAVGSLIPLRALDEQWPGNRTYVVNFFDLVNIESILWSFLDYAATGADVGQGASLSSNAITAIQAASNLSEVFQNVSLSMTHHIMSGSPNTTMLEGITQVAKPFIRVRWGWLALPIILVLLTWGFLLAAMILTKSADIPIWRTSLYPLLTLDVRAGSETKQFAATNWRLSEMETLSKRSTVPLSTSHNSMARYSRLDQ